MLQPMVMKVHKKRKFLDQADEKIDNSYKEKEDIVNGDDTALDNEIDLDFLDHLFHTPPPIDKIASTTTAMRQVSPPEDSCLTELQQILLVDLSENVSDSVYLTLWGLAESCSTTTTSSTTKNSTTPTTVTEQSSRCCITRTEELRRAGGATILAVVMRKWYNVPEIQSVACRILVCLYGPANVDVEYRKSAKDTGVMACAIWAIEQYPDHRDVQTTGIGALAAMALEESTACYMANVALRNYQGILAQMKKYPNDIKVQLRTCRLLSRLSDHFNTTTKQELMDGGSCGILSQAIENPLLKVECKSPRTDGESIRKYAKRALVNLLKD